MIDRCVMCGDYVVEGRQVCEMCELTNPKELTQILKKRAKKWEKCKDCMFFKQQKTQGEYVCNCPMRGDKNDYK